MSEITISVDIPKLIIHVDCVGTNSLIGALCEEFIKRDLLIHDIGTVNPEGIIFSIRKVMPEIDVFKELIKVRDIMKIDESKITLIIAG